MFLSSLVILIVAFVAWYQFKYGRRNTILSLTPSPKKYPLIHNIPTFYNKTHIERFNTMSSLQKTLGSVYQMTMHSFDNSTFIVSDPKVAEAILSSQTLIDKSEDYDLIKAWLGTGLLISTGEKWHKRRKILTPSFHFQILEKFVEIMDEHGKVLVAKLEKFNGKEVDIFPLVNLYALDVICESAMGFEMNAQNKDSDYVKAVKEISEIFYERTFDPIRRIEFIYQFTEMYQREKAALKILHGFTDSVIKSRREELLNQKVEVNDCETVGIKKKMALLDLLLQATIDGLPLSNMDIREEVDTFMFGGHDTTTSGIAFCLYNIAKHPEVQKKILEEINREIGEGDIVLNLANLNKLHYLELVIKESLRLFPSVPFFARKFDREVTAGGYTFPEGSNVAIAPFLMGRDPKIFAEPLVFNPSRFDVKTTTEKMNPFAYVPFSAGPRNCVGQKFAIYELKSSICKIVKSFEISIPKGREEIEIYGDIVLKAANGVVLKINKR